MLYPKMTPYREVITLDGFWYFCKDDESTGIENKWYEQIPKGSRVIIYGLGNIGHKYIK